MNDFITIFRCAECGKWSHAQRKPKSHERFIRDDGWNAPPTAYVERIPPTYDYEGEGDDGGWKVRCGPFETYHAYREVTND